MRRFLNEKGQVEIPILFIIPALFVGMVLSIKLAQDVVFADVKLKETVAIAVTAAASRYNEGDKPRIDPEGARNAFEEMLANNLGLDSRLATLKNSGWEGRLDYRLIVYNGDSGVEYDYTSGRYVTTRLTGASFPSEFDLNGVKVSLSSPGVLASVTMNTKGFMGKQTSYERWAAARIIKKGNNTVVALEGKSS